MHQILKTILESNDVSQSLHYLQNEIQRLQVSALLADKLQNVRNDYVLMCDFLRRGYRDEKSDDVYGNLLRRIYAIAIDVVIDSCCRQKSSFISARRFALDASLQPDEVQKMLEGFVQNQAMLSLETESRRKELSASLYSQYFSKIRALFSAVLVSGMWSESQAEGFASLLVSPTVEPMHAMMLVSALMLSAMTAFDPYKWQVLVEVYRRADDVQVRQRALVGWVYSMPSMSCIALFPNYELTLKNLLADEQVRRDLFELQMQTLFCCNADADNEEIQRNIMPTLLKNSNMHMTRLGIDESAEDPMQDVFDPGAADRNMEEMEQSFKRMIDMQKSGADIYFGGFSQMKRFPFFYELSNWFCPFYINHPNLSHIREKFADNKFLDNLFENGPFCDSDKYSFALALATVIDKLPENVREMIGSNAVLGPVATATEVGSASFARRNYIQSLYRFYRLCDQRSDFANPFVLDSKGPHAALFFAYDVIAHSDAMIEDVVSVARFLMKRGQMQQLKLLLGKFSSSDDARILQLRASVAMREGQYAEAINLCRKISADQRNDETIACEAYCSFALKHFADAAVLYGQLVERHPNNKSYGLKLALSHLNNDNADEAVKILYRLDYEYPDDANVKRALAWALMMKGNIEQASPIYARLLAGTQISVADNLNAAYAKWIEKDIASAIQLLTAYSEGLKKKGKDARATISTDFANDAPLLDKYEIKQSERKIMLDIVAPL